MRPPSIDPKMVDKIRQYLQAILSESDNIRVRVAQLGMQGDEDIGKSAASIERCVMSIESTMVGTAVVASERKHWLIIGHYTKEVIGCCENQADVLCEEPEASFKEVDKTQCPVCGDM